MRCTIIILLVILELNIFSQEESLTNKVKFNEGVYLSYKDFAYNKPSLKLDQISFKNLEGGLPTQRYLYNFKSSPDIKIDMDTVRIWGICINGTPYINQSYFFESDPNYTKIKDYGVLEEHAYTFTRIMLIGHICHFTAEGENNGGEPLNDLMPDINDFRPRMTAKGNRISQQYVLKVSTGEIVKFKSSNLLKLISDDSELYNRYNALSDKKKKKEIFNFFREYNTKHPFII
jgi:hypothetical protein